MSLRKALAAALMLVAFSAADQRPGLAADPASPAEATAIFAGGCFWCMEPAFEKVGGVTSVTSGFDGGATPNPTYEQVSRGGTGYAESVKVVYDPQKVSYPQLLQVFWHNVDPLDGGGQFCDRGNQYRPAIFYLTPEQQKLAEASKQALADAHRFGDTPIAAQIVPATTFYAAEDYHQDFYKTHPAHYQAYRTGCGRDRRLQELWGADAGGH